MCITPVKKHSNLGHFIQFLEKASQSLSFFSVFGLSFSFFDHQSVLKQKACLSFLFQSTFLGALPLFEFGNESHIFRHTGVNLHPNSFEMHTYRSLTYSFDINATMTLALCKWQKLKTKNCNVVWIIL